MKNLDLREEKYLDIEKLINESLSEKKMEDEKEDLVLEYLCQSVSKYDSYDSIRKKADSGDPYAYLKLACWHIDHAKNVKDYCFAYQYAVKAEQMGYVEANYLLGQLYFYGTGCQKNRYRARKCFLKFVEKVNPKYLLNETVLADAYLKLAEIEKERKDYQKAGLYINQLHQYNQDYDIYISEYEKEDSDRRKENYYSIAVSTIGFFSFCASAFLLFRYLGAETLSTFSVLPQKEVIAVVDTVNIENDNVPLAMNVVDTAVFSEISEEEFKGLNYSEIPIAGVYSSTEYISKSGNYYGVNNLTDSRTDTWWQEGVRDNGVGQTITFLLPEESTVNAFMIENGKAISYDEYEKNNRVAGITINNDRNYKIHLKDELEKSYIVFDKPITGSTFTLRIDSVYPGNTYNDTCISQIVLYE